MNQHATHTSRTTDTIASRRLRVAATVAAQLAPWSEAELLTVTDPWHLPEYAGSEILPGLFQGGTEDDDVIYFGHGDRYADAVAYDVIITLYASAQPAPWGVEEVRYGFLDAGLDGADTGRVIRLARAAFDRWLAGDTVLIRCQAGLNRSGLVTALVLIMAGLSPAQAIFRIRERRSPAALFNQDFVTWLLTSAQAAVAEDVAA